MKLYIDSNVLLSYILSELGGIDQAQVAWTKDFLNLCSQKGYVLVFSDLTFREIQKIGYTSEEEVKNILKLFGITCKTVETANSDGFKSNEIEKKTKIHYPDSLHTRLALKSKSDQIITWNMKDFKKVKRLIKVNKPCDIT